MGSCGFALGVASAEGDAWVKPAIEHICDEVEEDDVEKELKGEDHSQITPRRVTVVLLRNTTATLPVRWGAFLLLAASLVELTRRRSAGTAEELAVIRRVLGI